MNISIISVFPHLYTEFLKTSLVARAQEKGIVQFSLDSYFSFVAPKERIDEPFFGPGPGMLIRPEVVEKVIEDKEQRFGKAYKIFFSPHGKKIDQQLLVKLAPLLQGKKHIMLLPARYEGMDARVEEYYADLVLSVGDFVTMAGDIPAMLFLEAFLRLIPDVVSKAESIEKESFSGALVDCPHYTQPAQWKGMDVPEVLRSGNHAKIEEWREEKAAERTVLGHFDWLRSHELTDKQRRLAKKFIPPHYTALLHSDVLLPDGKVGTTSVTSFDIHDAARSALTYDIKNYFIVTPLEDQQKVVRTLIDFWKTGPGLEYNPHRYEAIKRVSLVESLEKVVMTIEDQEGKKPLIIGTSARKTEEKMISYYDQEEIWSQNLPILFLFGTGKGLSPDLLDRCDYLLMPIEGLSDFNHLSVRSAIAIIFDRWLGLNYKK